MEIAYAAAGAAPKPGSSGQSLMVSMIPFVFVIAIFYVLLIRPQQKRQRQHQDMLSQLKKGDKVITTSGIIGTVIGVKEKVVVLRIADNVKVEFLRTAISSVYDSASEGESK